MGKKHPVGIWQAQNKVKSALSNSEIQDYVERQD